MAQRKKTARQQAPGNRPGPGKKPFLLMGGLEEPAAAFLSQVRVELLGNRQAVVEIGRAHV